LKAGLLAPCRAGTYQVAAIWHSYRGSAKHVGSGLDEFKLLAQLLVGKRYGQWWLKA
jgi:hypothetical protein